LGVIVTIAPGFLLLFAEARDSDAGHLVIGAVLMGLGAILVAGA
jgi:hypothetical protein